MVSCGSGLSFRSGELDQWPNFSLCQPIASRESALDIWPGHAGCPCCLSQLGSRLSSTKLRDWLRGEKEDRERRNGEVLDELLSNHSHPTGHRRHFKVYSTLVQRNFHWNYMQTKLFQPMCAQWVVCILSRYRKIWASSAPEMCCLPSFPAPLQFLMM